MTSANIKILVLFAVFLFAMNAFGEGLSTLIEVAESQKEMQEAVNKETAAFYAIKEALETGKLKKGQSQDLICRLYGKPVIIFAEKNKTEKWIYKPGYASYSDGIKIYLFFDGAKMLTGIKMRNSGKGM